MWGLSSPFFGAGRGGGWSADEAADGLEAGVGGVGEEAEEDGFDRDHGGAELGHGGAGHGGVVGVAAGDGVAGDDDLVAVVEKVGNATQDADVGFDAGDDHGAAVAVGEVAMEGLVGHDAEAGLVEQGGVGGGLHQAGQSGAEFGRDLLADGDGQVKAGAAAGELQQAATDGGGLGDAGDGVEKSLLDVDQYQVAVFRQGGERHGRSLQRGSGPR